MIACIMLCLATIFIFVTALNVSVLVFLLLKVISLPKDIPRSNSLRDNRE